MRRHAHFAPLTTIVTLSLLLIVGCGSTVTIATTKAGATPTTTAVSGGNGPTSPTATAVSGGNPSGPPTATTVVTNNPTVTPTTSTCTKPTNPANGLNTIYTHVVTSSNISQRLTFLDNGLINCAANIAILVTPNWTAGSHIYDTSQVGVIYLDGRWAIINEGNVPMQVGMAFNVFIPHGGIGFGLVTSDATNTSGDRTVFSSPNTDNNPNAQVIVTQNNGSDDDVRNIPTALGVYYTGSKWAVFREDKLPMPLNTTFSFALGGGIATTFVHQVLNVNPNVDYSMIVENPFLSTLPAAIVFATPNWSYANNSVYDPRPTGVFFSGQWSVFHEDKSYPIPLNISYNIVITPSTT